MISLTTSSRLWHLTNLGLNVCSVALLATSSLTKCSVCPLTQATAHSVGAMTRMIFAGHFPGMDKREVTSVTGVFTFACEFVTIVAFVVVFGPTGSLSMRSLWHALMLSAVGASSQVLLGIVVSKVFGYAAPVEVRSEPSYAVEGQGDELKGREVFLEQFGLSLSQYNLRRVLHGELKVVVHDKKLLDKVYEAEKFDCDLLTELSSTSDGLKHFSEESFIIWLSEWGKKFSPILGSDDVEKELLLTTGSTIYSMWKNELCLLDSVYSAGLNLVFRCNGLIEAVRSLILVKDLDLSNLKAKCLATKSELYNVCLAKTNLVCEVFEEFDRLSELLTLGNELLTLDNEKELRKLLNGIWGKCFAGESQACLPPQVDASLKKMLDSANSLRCEWSEFITSEIKPLKQTLRSPSLKYNLNMALRAVDKFVLWKNGMDNDVMLSESEIMRRLNTKESLTKAELKQLISEHINLVFGGVGEVKKKLEEAVSMSKLRSESEHDFFVAVQPSTEKQLKHLDEEMDWRSKLLEVHIKDNLDCGSDSGDLNASARRYYSRKFRRPLNGLREIFIKYLSTCEKHLDSRTFFLEDLNKTHDLLTKQLNDDELNKKLDMELVPKKLRFSSDLQDEKASDSS